MTTEAPTLADFVRPLIGTAYPEPSPDTPLGRLPAGDYAVLAWLDGVVERPPAAVEADLVARWHTAGLDEVRDLLFRHDDPDGPPVGHGGGEPR